MGPKEGDSIPDAWSVALLPDQDSETLRSRYEPLLDYLSEKTEIPYELHLAGSYGELLDWFHDGRINLVLFGGVTFVMAHEKDQAWPIALRDVDGRFSSVLLVRNDPSVQRISDLAGESLAFGSLLSTSGHLMPRHFLGERGVDVDSFFGDVSYSGAHDLTARWVRDGLVSAGISNSGVVRRMFEEGELSADDVRILWQSPPFVDYVWATSSEIDEATRLTLREAFLSLSSGNPVHRKILERVGADYYLPARASDYEALRPLVLRFSDRLKP